MVFTDPEHQNDPDNIDIDMCIRRAKNALQVAYRAKNIRGQGPNGARANEFGLDKRAVFATAGVGYAQLALALQAERDYEERKIDKIKEQNA